MIPFLLNNLHYLWLLLLLGLLAAAALAPLEAMGWWAGWWLRSANAPDDTAAPAKPTTPAREQAGSPAPANHYIVFLTGIGGSTEKVNVPLEVGLIARLRTEFPDANVIDTIYPYSVANRGLTEGRFLATVWRWVLQEKLTGHRALGFMINLRNLLQVLVCADHRYGAFFSQGAAQVIVRELQRAGYDFAGSTPLTIIGYSGGGQIAVGAAPYLAEVLPAPVDVISLGGVLSSTPHVNRIDRVVHIYSNKDSVQRLAMIFPGRWRFAATSAWNRGRRAGRISAIFLPNIKHDGPGGYLDPHSQLPDGRSHLDQTVQVIGHLLKTPLQPIPDDPPLMRQLHH
ncbi:MAG: hypothetical protein KDE53_06420 [Caldilineaceae bacterium]|nr:hypothetical protein [Caldilineaceae bacterium]